MSAISNGPSPVQALPAPKQIRFVNNEGQPPVKRRRINAACLTCRKRKTRCDGKRPQCATCTENGHECLGYTDIFEGRRGSKGADAIRNGNDDVEDYEDDKANIHPAQRYNGGKPFINGSPRLHRAHSSSYHDRGPDHGREERGTGRVIRGEYSDTAGFPDEDPSSLGRSHHVESHRVPYFRYFGPTAIVPGFKQMVVSVREHRRSTGGGSAIPVSPGSSVGGGSTYGKTSAQAGTDPRSSIDMPIYDLADSLPVHRLIVHLVETFFTHLGCNFPFLQQKTFTQRVEERSVEPILVDAVCSLAARFSDHALLTSGHDTSYPKSEYGHVFAQRAKAAVVDTFPCPTVAAVQACLLLAYEGFGSNQDSALWMYLGCAIRMAVDLGLQKLDGVKHQGQKDPGYRRASLDNSPSDAMIISAQERREIEQERIDTLWAVFMLDRVISSGTGRPVTLRDDDFELSFPSITSNPQSGWPDPFPALIQIIHLYGRVSDLLNNIKHAQDVTQKTIEGLSSMERELTELYQKLDHRLTFNATNFHHFVKSGEGTNFILLHFWFHTLIMLLHQPSLIHSFESKILQLLPNSRELSMSSAKTIADILAFAELIDPRSFIGNPFTSQPMYIAACAFLMESAAHSASQPTSRSVSPPPPNASAKDKRSSERAPEQKHSLLASAATQNYQRCYKSLQQLEVYWAGTRYILVALDQKAKGIWDPETYTEQEYAAARRHEIIPHWRGKLALATAPSPASRFSDFARSPRPDTGSPAIDPSQAFGFSLTGTTNSPSSNLTFMYQNMNGEQHQQQQPLPIGAGNMIYDPIRQTLPENAPGSTSASIQQSRYHTYTPTPRHSRTMPPPAPKYTTVASDPVTTSDAEMLLGLQNSPFTQTPNSHHSFDAAQSLTTTPTSQQDQPFDFSQHNPNLFNQANGNYMGLGGVGDMMLESQEIDMSTLGGDMIPWLEYLPQDMLQFFEGGSSAGMASTGQMNDTANIGAIARSGG